MNLPKVIFLSFLAGILTVFISVSILLYFRPEIIPNIWGVDPLEVHNKMVGKTEYITKRMTEEEERAHRNPKFYYMAGRTDSGTVYSVRVAEKGSFFIFDRSNHNETFRTFDIGYRSVEFDFLRDQLLEGTPVFLIFDNSEKIELFFDYIDNDGKPLNTHSISRDYAERTQRKILDAELITIEYTDKSRRVNKVDFDVRDLWVRGLYKL